MERATTRQVHQAIRTAVKNNNARIYGQWTDKALKVPAYAAQFHPEELRNRRYLSYHIGQGPQLQKIVDDANFILWLQKVTADLRVKRYYIRATASIV